MTTQVADLLDANPRPAIAGKAEELFRALHANGTRYCHWKSNVRLLDGLCGDTDIDLLVHREHASTFRALVASCGFKPASPAANAIPSTEHFFARDADSGVLLHLHAYFKVLTGQSFAKNYRLPLEHLLLSGTNRLNGVRVPPPGAEALVFTVRMLLKHTSLVEVAMLLREWEAVRREAETVLGGGGLSAAAALLPRWLPCAKPSLFERSGRSLLEPSRLVGRVWLGLLLRRSLRPYARRSRAVAWWTTGRAAMSGILRRVARRRDGMIPASGGLLVAVVGAEASGKSTLIDAAARWLGQHFLVEKVHAGKPRSTLLTALPNLVVPLLRVLLPGRRSSRVTATNDHQVAEGGEREPVRSRPFPILFGIRSVLLAHDRRALLVRAAAHAANGAIVFCDRYPFAGRGSPDGPQLSAWAPPGPRDLLRAFLARLEARLYAQVPPADLVMALRLPLDVALERNRRRGKQEPEDYVRRRHAQMADLAPVHPALHNVDTSGSLDRSVREVQRILWDSL